MDSGDVELIRALTKLNPELTKKYTTNPSSSTAHQRPGQNNDKLMPDVIPALRNVDSTKYTSPLASPSLQQENERLKGVFDQWKSKCDDLCTKQDREVDALARSKKEVAVLRAREETHLRRLYFLQLENETLKRDLDGSQSDNAPPIKEINSINAENDTLKKAMKGSNARMENGMDKLKDVAAEGYGREPGHNHPHPKAVGSGVNSVQKKEIPIANAKRPLMETSVKHS